MAGKKEETKLEAVCLEEGKTYRQVAEELGLCRAELAKNWVRRYRWEGDQGLDRPIGRPRKSPQSRAAYIARLEMEKTLLNNIITNCANPCSRGAISGH